MLKKALLNQSMKNLSICSGVANEVRFYIAKTVDTRGGVSPPSNVLHPTNKHDKEQPHIDSEVV